MPSNTDEKKAYLREYYRRNRERLKASAHARYHGLSDDQIAVVRAQTRVRARRYRDADPDKYRAKVANYSARKRGAAVHAPINAAERAAMVAFYGGLCVRCDAALVGKGNCHLDHVVPVARGGAHTIANLQPLCASCNVRKNRSIADYRPLAVGWFAYQGGA